MNTIFCLKYCSKYDQSPLAAKRTLSNHIILPVAKRPSQDEIARNGQLHKKFSVVEAMQVSQQNLVLYIELVWKCLQICRRI